MYTRVATADDEALIGKTIKVLSAELDPTLVWQVHRAIIVNVHAIDSVVRDERGNMQLRLKHRSEALHHRFKQMWIGGESGAGVRGDAGRTRR